MRKIFFFLFFMLFTVSANAAFIYNPHTGKLDYYEAAAALTAYTVATLPAAPSDGDTAVITDGADAADCTAGEGTELNICIYDGGGAAWVIAGDGAGSGNAFSTHDAPAGTDPVASGADTLTWDDTAPIVITGNSATDTITISITDASTSAKGAAQFNSDNFAAASGVITIKDAGVAKAEIADADFGDFTISSNTATLDADVVAAAEMADADHGMVSWSSGAATVEDFALNADADAGDVDIKSLDKLEFFDTAIYIDGGADTLLEIVADTRVDITSAAVRLEVDADAYLSIVTADGGATTIAQTSDGTDQITIGDGSDRVDIATNTWDVTNGVISASAGMNLTAADAQLINLGGITHTAATDEGLVLPTWADVVPTTDQAYLAVDGSNLKLYNGGWVTIEATGAPTDATYITQTPDATLSAEQALSALDSGLMYVTTATGAITTATEAQAEATLGIGFGDSKVATSGYILVADGADFESVAMSSDATIATGGAVTIANDAVTMAKLDDDGNFTDWTGNWTFATGTVTLSNGATVAAEIDSSSTISANLFVPDAADGAALGSATLEFSDLYLATGGKIYGDSGQLNTLTGSATAWTANLDFNITGSSTISTNLTVDGTLTADTIAQGAVASPSWLAQDSSANEFGTFDIKVDAVTLTEGARMNLYVDEGNGAAGNEDQLFIRLDGAEKAANAGTIEMERLTNFEMGLSTSNEATSAGFVDFYEDTDDGVLKTRLIAGDLTGGVGSSQTYILPVDAYADTEVLAINASGQMYWTTAGSATAWHNLNPPTTDETLAMGSYTTQWTWTETAADMFTIFATGAFGNYSVMRIEQKTGNPTDGELLSLAVADTEANVDQLAIFNGTDESELTRLVDGGSITRTLVSTDGFAQWLFSTVEDGTGATDTDGIFEIITNATMDADQDILNVVKGTDTLFSVDEDGDVALDGGLTVGTTIGMTGALSGVTTASFSHTAPEIFFLDSTTSGEAKIIISDAAGPDAVMDLQVDLAGTLTTYIQLDGINDWVDVIKTLQLTEDIVPNTSDGSSLGTDALDFSDLFLADAGVINFDSGDATITHATANLTIAHATGDLVLSAAASDQDITLTVDDNGADWSVVLDGSESTVDFADVDLTSVDKVEFYDTAVYIDGGADGVLDIAADTAVDFKNSVIRASKTYISDQGGDADDAYTAVEDDKGGIIINAADDDPLVITLPTAVAGECYTILSVEAQVITVDVDGSDQIMVYTNAAGDSIDSPGAAGDFVKLCAVDATEWYVVGMSGAWVDGD